MIKMTKTLALGLGALAAAVASGAAAYPIDGYDYTGIDRLEFYRLAQLGEISGRQLPDGGKLPLAAVQPGWPEAAQSGFELPPRDADLEAKVRRMIAPDERGRYGIAILDFSDRNNPRYAEFNAGYKSNVGSVGKTLVALAVFDQLADIYPASMPGHIEAREAVLRDTRVVADEWIVYDHHKVPLFDVAERDLDHRRLRVGDEGSLWEYLDWMMSASSNAAASAVMKELLLLAHYRDQYPVSQALRDAYFEENGYKARGELLERVMDAAVVGIGASPDDLRQGSFFTRTGKRKVASRTSRATPRTLMRLLWSIETGTAVDQWSSRELKRLMYITQRRIRYASHPALHDAALYFKTGSLYSCKEEPGFTCEKYKGNRINILGSIASVEMPARAPKYRYLVAVISNVLYKNSAVAHQTLAMRIQRMLEAEHANTVFSPGDPVRLVDDPPPEPEPVEPPPPASTGLDDQAVQTAAPPALAPTRAPTRAPSATDTPPESRQPQASGPPPGAADEQTP